MSKVPINRSQGRSVVVSTRGIVATEHPLASQAGAKVLAQGGHAVDAAVAANAVMGVVCPMMCGVGGDLFAIVCEDDGKMHGVNASGWAPARLTPEFLESRNAGGMPQSGVHSITVPGAVAGWSLLLERFGRMPLARVLEAATTLAAEGFPVAEITSEEWHNQAPFLRGDPEAARDVSAGRAPALVRRGLPQQRSRVDVSPDCRERQRRVLSRRDRAPARRGARAARLDDGRRRSVGVPRAVGRSDFDELPRLGRFRAAAERRRHCGADDVEHHGGV